MRVLSVMRHWVTKHGQDFEGNHQLMHLTIEFLEDIVCTRTLLPAEHKAASQLLREIDSTQIMQIISDCFRMLTKEEPAYNLINVESLLAPSLVMMKNVPPMIFHQANPALKLIIPVFNPQRPDTLSLLEDYCH